METLNSPCRPDPMPAQITAGQRARPLLVALLWAIYLLNLSGGWLEIPGCLPIVGNLDEAATVLLKCLGILGWTGSRREVDDALRGNAREGGTADAQ